MQNPIQTVGVVNIQNTNNSPEQNIRSKNRELITVMCFSENLQKSIWKIFLNYRETCNKFPYLPVIKKSYSFVTYNFE